MTPGLEYSDQALFVLLHFCHQSAPIRQHNVESLGQHLHDLEAHLVASLQLTVGEVDTFEQGADLQEELESVLFDLHIAIVVHLADQFALDPLKIVAEDVVQDNLMQRAD